MDVDSGYPVGWFSPTYKLQWSHVLMDVDRVSRYPRGTDSCRASMEPRPDGRG